MSKQCKKCSKSRRIGGCKMTKWTCPVCKKDQWSGLTCHEKICISCAEKLNKCHWCGEDYESTGTN